ncbi:MAG: glycosyltransferase family 39 protein [Phycisphaerae bacterium]|nr:glycosyltransferase family 39 protein [Phycisphaerae bacterium]
MSKKPEAEHVFRKTGTTSPLALDGRQWGAYDTMAILALVVFSVVWLALAMTVFFVGPAEWDDNQYCDIAAAPRANAHVPNRYAHIWTLRVFYLLMESRQSAAALYSALTVVGLMWVAYFVGRRISGPACGLIAALLMPFYPVLLKYLTVPYSDEPMALWSGVALLCALLAAETSSSRTRWITVLASGMCCLLSVKCKETGMAILPVVLLVLWRCDGKAKVLGQLVGGILLGWACLVVVDWIFMGDMWFSCRWSTYFRKGGGNSGGGGTVRCGTEYLEFLTSRPFLVFSLLGVGGALHSFRENRMVRYVVLWALGAILFQSLISCRYKGLHALDRYCVGIGVPLVILGALWLVKLWEQPRADSKGHPRPIGLTLVLALLVGLTAYGLGTHLAGGCRPAPKETAWRCYFFMLPLTAVVLFAVPWLTSSRWLRRSSLVMLAVLGSVMSVAHVLPYVQRSQAKLKPWVELAKGLDETGATLAMWELSGKPFNPLRVVWRTRALSSSSPERIKLRQVSSLDEVGEGEWVITDAKWWQNDTEKQRELRRRGWRPFVHGFEGRKGFVVCRRDLGE